MIWRSTQSGSPPRGKSNTRYRKPAFAGAGAHAQSAPGDRRDIGQMTTTSARSAVDETFLASKNGPFPAGRPPGGGRPARDGGEPRYAAVPAQLGRPQPCKGPAVAVPSAGRFRLAPHRHTSLPDAAQVAPSGSWPLPGHAHSARRLTRHLHSGPRNALTCGLEGNVARRRHRKSRNNDARDKFSNRADRHGLQAWPVVVWAVSACPISACLEPHPPPYQPLSRSSSDHLVSGGAQGTERLTGLMDHWPAP